MKKYFLRIALPLMLLSSGPAFAQGTLENYNRAYSLRQKFSGYQVYHSDVNPHWVTGTSSFWYLQRTPQGNEYLLVDADRQTRRPSMPGTCLWTREIWKLRSMCSALCATDTTGAMRLRPTVSHAKARCLHAERGGTGWRPTMKKGGDPLLRLTESMRPISRTTIFSFVTRPADASVS